MESFSADEQARVLYLALLGMVLLVGLFAGYRDRLGEAMQHAAIWVLIFLGAVLAYGFKDDIMAQLQPNRALVSGEEIRLARAADGHFRAELTVNGVAVDFLVDTGATEMVLSQRDAARVGLDPSGLAYTRRAQTANGTVSGAPVSLERVVFAGMTDSNVPAVVNGGRLNTSLLGMSYLNRFSSLSIEGERMILRR